MSQTTASDRREPPARRDSFVARLYRLQTGPLSCPISPRETDEGRQFTEWVTATRGSFVPLDTMR